MVWSSLFFLNNKFSELIKFRNSNYFSFKYFDTASRRIKERERCSFSAISSTFARSFSSMSKHAFVFMISILSLLYLYCFLYFFILLYILSYTILIETIIYYYHLILNWQEDFILSLERILFLFWFSPFPPQTVGNKQRETEED